MPLSQRLQAFLSSPDRRLVIRRSNPFWVTIESTKLRVWGFPPEREGGKITSFIYFFFTIDFLFLIFCLLFFSIFPFVILSQAIFIDGDRVRICLVVQIRSWFMGLTGWCARRPSLVRRSSRHFLSSLNLVSFLIFRLFILFSVRCYVIVVCFCLRVLCVLFLGIFFLFSGMMIDI